MPGDLADQWKPGPLAEAQEKSIRLTGNKDADRKKAGTYKMAFWNSCHLSVMLLDMLVGSQDGGVKGLGYDLIACAELHGDEQWIQPLWGQNRMAIGEAPPEDGSDPASGVCVIMSSRLSRCEKLGGRGCKGSRIAWVTFDAQPALVVVIVAYIPHHGRRCKPYARDVWQQLAKVYKELPARYCKILKQQKTKIAVIRTAKR